MDICLHVHRCAVWFLWFFLVSIRVIKLHIFDLAPWKDIFSMALDIYYFSNIYIYIYIYICVYRYLLYLKNSEVCAYSPQQRRKIKNIRCQDHSHSSIDYSRRKTWEKAFLHYRADAKVNNSRSRKRVKLETPLTHDWLWSNFRSAYACIKQWAFRTCVQRYKVPKILPDLP